MWVHQEGVYGWNDRAGVSVDMNGTWHALKWDKNTLTEVSTHGGSLSVAPGREGCLFIHPPTAWVYCVFVERLNETVAVFWLLRLRCPSRLSGHWMLEQFCLSMCCDLCMCCLYFLFFSFFSRCDSPEKLKALLPRLEQELKDSGKFKDFYQFTFNFAKNPGQKGLGKFTDCDLTIDFWLILQIHKHLNKVVSFV